MTASAPSCMAKFALLACFVPGVVSFSVPVAPLATTTSRATPLYACQDPCHVERRAFLLKACATAATFLPPTQVLAEEENGFIKELKARSDANRQEYNQHSRSAGKLSSDQFASQYDRPKFTAIRRVDGTYKMVTQEVLEDLQAKGLVVAEYDKAISKDGEEKVDFKKGKILQFPNAEAQAKAKKGASPAPAPKPVPEPMQLPNL